MIRARKASFFFDLTGRQPGRYAFSSVWVGDAGNCSPQTSLKAAPPRDRPAAARRVPSFLLNPRATKVRLTENETAILLAYLNRAGAAAGCRARCAAFMRSGATIPASHHPHAGNAISTGCAKKVEKDASRARKSWFGPKGGGTSLPRKVSALTRFRIWRDGRGKYVINWPMTIEDEYRVPLQRRPALSAFSAAEPRCAHFGDSL